MKVLHTSDWHLGAAENEHPLKEDQEFFIDEICRIIDEEQIEVVLLAGDVYDRSLPGAEAIKLYDRAMTEICLKRKVPVICIAGNHDGPSQLANCSGLLKEAGLHVCGILTSEPQIVSIGNADFYMLPWFSAEKVRSLYPEQADQIRNLQDAYQLVCNHLRETFVAGRKHIAVSHAFISGASYEDCESNKAASVGTADQVSADVFEGFDYVALGHIHGPQTIKGHDKVRYSGTPMIYSFGKEEKQVKSVTIIDTDTMEQRVVPLQLLHKWTTLEDTMETLLKAEYPEDVMKGYVNIKVTDQYLGLESTRRLKELYPLNLGITGKSFENAGGSTFMTMEEFRTMENNPMEIFKRFCQEIGGVEADEHMLDLFEKAVQGENEEEDR